MSNKAAGRDRLEQLMRAAAEYRDAFARVEKALESAANPKLPEWVYNLARMDLAAIRGQSPEVARAEAHRRAARVALHAVAELLAHDDPGLMLGEESALVAASGATLSRLNTSISGGGEDRDALRVLDRFIGIVRYADEGGCLYLDGTIEPLALHDGADVDDYTGAVDLGD